MTGIKQLLKFVLQVIFQIKMVSNKMIINCLTFLLNNNFPDKIEETTEA